MLSDGKSYNWGRAGLSQAVAPVNKYSDWEQIMPNSATALPN